MVRRWSRRRAGRRVECCLDTRDPGIDVEPCPVGRSCLVLVAVRADARTDQPPADEHDPGHEQSDPHEPSQLRIRSGYQQLRHQAADETDDGSRREHPSHDRASVAPVSLPLGVSTLSHHGVRTRTDAEPYTPIAGVGRSRRRSAR